jgi:cation:H+ antiporter
MTVMAIVLVAIGIVALIFGADWLVRGAASLAARTGMSSVVIGLTVVAFGTSAPELAVSLGGALRGDEGGSLALGNVIGSNIANILLALGIAAAVGGGLIVVQRIVRIDVPIMIGLSVLVLVMALDERLGRVDGVILTAGLVTYTSWTVIAARRDRSIAIEAQYTEGLDVEELAGQPLWRDLLLLVAGLGLLVLGSQSLVEGASDIAADLGVSDLVIGLTVVAVGTSMPEIATTVLAVMRGQRDLAVGNAIGSNIFNILSVLGITALVVPDPIPVAEAALQVDLPVMVIVAVATLPIFANGYELKRWEGTMFVALYVGYIVWLVLDATDSGLRDAYGNVALFFVVPLLVITLAVVTYRARIGRSTDA